MSDFHRDMDQYLTNKRRKRLFSGIKSKIMNKKAVVSYKAANKFGKLKGKLTSKVDEIKNKKEETEKQITQEQINKLVEEKGIRGEPIGKIKSRVKDIKEDKESGWKEVKLEWLQEKREGMGGLGEEKRKLQEDLVKIEEKERLEKEKLAKLNEENEQREKAESKEDKAKRLDLEEEVKILKEKQRIEEDRLTELRKARRLEQMQALRGRVTDILFKKRPKKEKNMAEEVRKHIRREARIKETEKQKAKAGQPKEDVTKDEAKTGEIKKPEEAKPESSEVKKEQKKPKKSFFSNFIQIRTAAQIAEEEQERLRREEEALKGQSEISKVFHGEGEVKTNMPAEEQNINFSTLFPGEKTPQKQVQNSKMPAEEGVNLSTLFPGENVQQKAQEQEGTIDLGDDYKIKVVEN